MRAASNNVCVAGAARAIARRHVATHQKLLYQCKIRRGNRIRVDRS